MNGRTTNSKNNFSICAVWNIFLDNHLFEKVTFWCKWLQVSPEEKRSLYLFQITKIYLDCGKMPRKYFCLSIRKRSEKKIVPNDVSYLFRIFNYFFLWLNILPIYWIHIYKSLFKFKIFCLIYKPSFMTKNWLFIKRQTSDTRLTSDSNLYHELPYRGKLRRGKVTKFQLSD